MKRIYIHTLIALVTVLTVSGTLIQKNAKSYFYSWYAFVQLKKDISLGKIQIGAPEILALGNSQMQSGFMAAQLENSYNLAYPGTSIIENYYLLKKYLENNTAPKIVLYGLFPQNNYLYSFNFWNLHIRYGAYSFNEIFDIFLSTLKTNNFLMFTGERSALYNSLRFLYYALAFKLNFPAQYQNDLHAIIERRPVYVNFKFYQSQSLLEKGFYSFSTPPDINETIRLRLIEERKLRGDTFVPEPLLQLYWLKFMMLLQEHKISLISFHMPNHSKLAHAVGTEVEKGSERFYRSFFSKYENTHFVKTINLQDSEYLDIQHYTRSGAENFTKQLIEEIKKGLPKEAFMRN